MIGKPINYYILILINQLEDLNYNNLAKFSHEMTAHYGYQKIAPFHVAYKKIIESECYLNQFDHFEMPEEYKRNKNQFYKKKIIKKIGFFFVFFRKLK